MLPDMLPLALIEDVVDRALIEDLEGGDITSAATVDPSARAVARAVAKSELTVCGEAVFRSTFTRTDPDVSVVAEMADGTTVSPGTVIWTVRGNARAVLAAERTALNFAQRMSGTASMAARFVALLPAGSRARITDTRKTTPGLRALERYAVRCGGAHNHRDELGSAVLIKDNHIVAAGGVRRAIERARAHAPHTTRVEIEVASDAMLDEALAAGADIVMLDNFAPDRVGPATARCHERGVLVEVSGGIGEDRIAELAAHGVDVISVGALTHSAPAADISLQLELES